MLHFKEFQEQGHLGLVERFFQNSSLETRLFICLRHHGVTTPQFLNIQDWTWNNIDIMTQKLVDSTSKEPCKTLQ